MLTERTDFGAFALVAALVSLAANAAPGQINLSARAAAAELIGTRVAEISSKKLDPLNSYRQLGSDVLALGDIGPGAAARIQTAMTVAQQQADPAAAAATLEKALRWLESDIRFSPVIEAPLPADFPSPTLVDEVEVKSYPQYRMAVATSESVKQQKAGRWWARGDNSLFFALFDHINAKSIPMTTPVEMNVDETNRTQRMGFMYRNTQEGATGPDGAVEVVDVPAAVVVSIGMRGYSNDAAVKAAKAKLHQYLATRPDLEPAGELRVMGWNSPSVSSARRYFEVQIPVRAKQAN